MTAPKSSASANSAIPAYMLPPSARPGFFCFPRGLLAVWKPADGKFPFKDTQKPGKSQGLERLCLRPVGVQPQKAEKFYLQIEASFAIINKPVFPAVRESPHPAGVMELVDVVDSKSTAGDSVPVRVRSPAPKKKDIRRRKPHRYTM